MDRGIVFLSSGGSVGKIALEDSLILWCEWSLLS
jgi:hypothetical protein